MATKHQKMQKLIRYYKDKTGKTEIDMKEVAKFAVSVGWEIPRPTDPIDRLAKEFAQAAREEIRYNKKTRKPYRVNHSITQKQGSQQLHLWIRIDEAPRKLMHKSLIARREQMVGDGLQLTYDADQWNSLHKNDKQIILPMDFTDDIEWRKNSPDEKQAAA